MNNSGQLAVFKLADTYFGIDILYVNEIIQDVDISYVDGLSDYVMGLLNLRGQVVTVIDLAQKIQRDSKEHDRRSPILILKTQQQVKDRSCETMFPDDTCDDLIGLRVDEVRDMMSVGEDEVMATSLENDHQFLNGILHRDETMIEVLSLGRVLETDESTLVKDH